MRKMILAASILFLSACTSTPAVPPVVSAEKPVYHPAMPRPIEVCNVHWEVLIVNNTPYVALTYEDNINFAKCGMEQERYLSELLLVTCHYRQCSKDNNDNNNKTRN